MDLIIFDNDGVLVDSEPIACGVLSVLLTELGLETTYQDVLDKYLGGSIDRTREMAETALGRSLPEWFESAFHDRLFERLPKELKPVDDVAWAIQQLNVRSCVASSGSLERIQMSLRLTGLLDFFGDHTFSSTQVENGKPAPDLFLYAAEKMGATPASCVVIEDSPLGIEAANRAGMASIGFSTLTPPDRLSAASGGVISSMRDLPDRLKTLDL